ncbi:MAG: hypothetical protein BACD_00097 [Bacteroides rodentium]
MKRTIIITGANSGLGFESAKKIAKASNYFYLIMACRNMEKAEQAKEKKLYKRAAILMLDAWSWIRHHWLP